MDDQNKNLILATALSFLVILVWFVLFPPEKPVPADQTTSVTTDGTVPAANVPAVDPATTAAATTEADPSNVALENAPRIEIKTPQLTGSISLLGGRIDDLSLNKYLTSLKPDAGIVKMLSPAGETQPYYALYGWAPGAGMTLADVPSRDTLWSVERGDILTPDTPLDLVWKNETGLTFRRTISVDDTFMFTVTQSVENQGSAPASMAPYGLLARHGEPQDLKNFFILHEGVVSMSDGELAEIDYDDMPDFEVNEREGVPANRVDGVKSGWIGFTDHFWMTTLIPDNSEGFRLTSKYFPRQDIYQTETVLPTQTVAPGQAISVSTRLFAGAKEWETIRNYEKQNVEGFIDSIDWGWFFFLTKPIFWLLHEINKLIGNMGWSIIGLTLIIKAVLLPLAYKSYVSMARMKELQPEMEKLKERAGDDKQALQQGMMEMYKKNKVNPASGCLPILLQIPIFFSLYKVIFVTIELRHAPWLGWIRDLSAPDPSSILNLFGLLSFAPPEPGSLLAIISLGVLPIILGISMWLQQKLNPAPTDPTQQMIFAWMPWIFMFMLGSFASGLVLYWIANNTITFTQQYLIMRSQGIKPNVFGNIKAGLAKKPKTDSK